jgi:hypothetical protein
MKLLLTTISLFLIIVSCKKVDQALPASVCKITKVYTITEDGPDTALFSYTAWGAPSSIVVANERSGNSSYFFQYDTHQNLVGFIAGFTPNPGVNDTTYESYRRFYYKNGRIDSDSFFTFGSVKHPNYDENIPRSAGKYYYDSYGRVIKYESDQTTNYSYPNVNPYINNTNIVGTHPVLMFVNRDFNRNNQNVLTTNSFGMPTTFSNPYWFSDMRISKVEYAWAVPLTP